MTVLTLGRALARGRAEPIATVRHLHVSTRPLVFIPLKMTGEASAPMAAMVGTDRDNPQLLVVAQPRNRDQRFAFAHSLARIVLAEIRPMAEWQIPRRPSPPDPLFGAPTRRRSGYPDRAGIEFVRPLGRSTRLPNTTGPWKLPPTFPDGGWLTFYADRAEYPGSSLLVAATAALAQHRATGQSAEEDEHLGTVLAWIQPPLGMTAARGSALAASWDEPSTRSNVISMSYSAQYDGHVAVSDPGVSRVRRTVRRAGRAVGAARVGLRERPCQLRSRAWRSPPTCCRC